MKFPALATKVASAGKSFTETDVPHSAEHALAVAHAVEDVSRSSSKHACKTVTPDETSTAREPSWAPLVVCSSSACSCFFGSGGVIKPLAQEVFQQDVIKYPVELVAFTHGRNVLEKLALLVSLCYW